MFISTISKWLIAGHLLDQHFPPYTIYAGLSFHRVTGVHINNMAVVNSRQFGINAYSCQGELIIKDSHFHGNGDPVFSGGNARFLYEDCSDTVNTLEIKSSSFSEGRTSLGDSTAAGIMITALCSELKVTFEAIAATNNSGGNIMLRMNYLRFQKWSVVVHFGVQGPVNVSKKGYNFVTHRKHCQPDNLARNCINKSDNVSRRSTTIRNAATIRRRRCFPSAK